MRVTLLASADFALPTLERLMLAGHEVSVGTQPARPAGRGRRARPTPIAARCADLGLNAEELDDVDDKPGLEWLTSTQPDVVVVVAFGQKLGPAVRAAGPWGCFNIHPSLLPRWRGAAPVQASLLAGDEETGVCVIDVVERMDAGDVLASRRTPTRDKTAGDLLEELAETGADLLLEVLDAVARGDARRTPQDESAVTRSRKISADDGRIRWEHEAREVDFRVRAMSPRPGAFTCLPDGARLKLIRGDAVPCTRGHLPGEVLDADGLLIACGSGAFQVKTLQREGGKPMDTEAFLRGFPITASLRMGP